MRCRNEYFFGGPGKSPKLNISQDTMNGVYIGGSNIEGGGGATLCSTPIQYKGKTISVSLCACPIAYLSPLH